MTPEQAFEKWWDKAKNRCSGADGSYSPWFSHECAFYAGQQYQETNQLMVLADIRKAVGDGEGRLSQEELVKRIEELVSPWRDIESAPKDGTVFLAYCWHSEGGYQFACTRNTREQWACMMSGDVQKPSHWMPLPISPVKSVVTEKEDA